MNTKKETISIQLVFNTNTLWYTAAVAPNHHMYLFSFRFNDGKWDFFTNWTGWQCDAIPVDGGFGDAFPMEYFTKLCQAKYMFEKGTLDFPEVELSKSAKKMLTKKFYQEKANEKFGTGFVRI